ncbi:hypothetical protein R1sor_024960 [Riccia sorocarpa]|uniref:Uncharacterized protein n=1 Tax=Riccia sorocarpa TaxID=122646 RepID=A0ABD3G8R5_9MARC
MACHVVWQVMTCGTETSTSLLGLIAKLLKPENTALAVAAIPMLRQIWRGRCKQVYEGRSPALQLDVILTEANKPAVNLKRKFSSVSKQEMLMNCHKTLTLMKWYISRDRGGNIPDPTRPGPSRNETEWPHNPEGNEEERRTNRADASDGRHPKERRRDQGNVSIYEPTYNLPTREEQLSIPTSATRMIDELRALGFEEIRDTENQGRVMSEM